VVLAAVPFAATVPAASGADECTNYRAIAAADGVRVSFDSPGFLVIEHTDVGAPVAQVTIDSFGTSAGYAAYPDIGEEVLSALPQLGGISREVYPLFVESQHPSIPEARLNTPVLNIIANSRANWGRAVAETGAGSTGLLEAAGLIRASATAECSDVGEVIALGENTFEGLGLTDILRIGRVHSMAKVVVGADGKPTVTSDIEVSLLTANGLPVEITPDGVSTGLGIPLIDLGLNELLKGLGIQISYLQAEPQADGLGITAPGVRISVTTNISGGADTVVSLTLGRAYAAAEGSPAEEFTPGTVADTPIPDSFTVPATSGTLPDLAAPTVTPPKRNLGPTAPVSVTGPFSASMLYAVMVLGAFGVLSSGLLFKWLGVKVGWR
jgi:hypothetical protein